MKKLIVTLVFIISIGICQGQNFYDYCQKNGRAICPSYTSLNCVQFMDVALKKYYGINNSELTKYTYINYPISTINKAIQTNQTNIVGGVAYGLVKFGYAEWVDIKDIQKGDIVQYWSTVGYTNGHCGIFHGYDLNHNMILVGSHQDSKGYGYMNVYNSNIECTFYVCRLKR